MSVKAPDPRRSAHNLLGASAACNRLPTGPETVQPELRNMLQTWPKTQSASQP
eukprot:CAMPEP_0202879532 /NCGR_PEP_ID=MMETSP1391-20130828/33752_1 /ASSEMBLY_ACC=CAM_ASM_000867 /TAXON_ID=1034604 /ORGANISM="Chlamydomonas leiostraca, Strain SAG 11-49" /LENGTH=52 /DNA_ID=CAMNT_0049561903 /DNA_START=285 /DNA_END=439 /DNA_ORIENTATION=+